MRIRIAGENGGVEGLLEVIEEIELKTGLLLTE